MLVRFLGLEDPLEEGMANHSSILAWEIPWTEEPGRLQSMGLQRIRHDLVINHHHNTRIIVSQNTTAFFFFFLFWKLVPVQADNLASGGFIPYSVIDAVCYLALGLSLMELSHIVNPRKFCDHGPHKLYGQTEQQQVADTSIVHISSVDAQASSSQNFSCKTLVQR